MIHSLLLLASVGSALAGNWTYNNTSNPWAIKSTLGPRSVGGDSSVQDLCTCNVNFDTNCLASDGGLTWASSWTYGTCVSTYDSATGQVDVSVKFDSGHDANGFATWPSSWPSTVSCSRTLVSPNAEAGYTHTCATTIANAVDTPSADTDWRFKAGSIVGTAISSYPASAVNFVVDSAFATRELVIDIPNGTYTGLPADSVAFMYDAATGGAQVNGTYCSIMNGSDEYVLIAAKRSLMPDLNGAAAGRGTVYCRFSYNGVAKVIPVSVTFN